jgi:hypothetical protein
VGRTRDTGQVRMIRWLSARGLMMGTVESAKLPALLAATSPETKAGGFYGPQWPGRLGGPPGEQKLWGPLRSGRGRIAPMVRLGRAHGSHLCLTPGEIPCLPSGATSPGPATCRRDSSSPAVKVLVQVGASVGDVVDAVASHDRDQPVGPQPGINCGLFEEIRWPRL